MRKSCATILLLSVCCLLPQCSRTPDVTTPSPNGVRTPAQLTQIEKNLVESVNRFSFKLFQRVNLNADPNKNVFVSPLSVSYALGILRNGANGKTRSEIDSALEIAGFSIDEANRAYQGLTSILIQADSAVTFNIANSFWSREGKQIQREFVRVCRDYYKARVEEMDFQAPDAASVINQWVSDNTNAKITQIVEPPISPDVASMLLNALYFKASWTFPFDVENTRQRNFRLRDGSQVSCELMFKDADEDLWLYPDAFKRQPNVYFHNSTLEGVHLPYGKQGYRMTVLLPDSSIAIDDFVQKLTPINWQGWNALPAEWDMWLRMPKFKFEFESSLNDALKALGMPSAFDVSQANFGEMFVDGIGWIDEVKHKTFVQVDEKGTEAAAVTEVWYSDALPPFFNADRPFLFVIHEIESGTILFMGKIVNPTLEK